MVFYEEWLSKEDYARYISYISDEGVMETLASFLEGVPDIKYFKRLIM